VWHDAKYLADQITNQRKYIDYDLARRGSRPQLR
jgi:putative flavoprotein involved in K+ transport